MVIRAACGGRRGFDTPFRKDGCGAGGDNGVGCDVKAGGRRSDTLWRNWWGTIVSPHETLRRLSEAGLSITSCIAYGLFPLLYSVSLLIAYQQGATPILWRPWVRTECPAAHASDARSTRPPLRSGYPHLNGKPFRTGVHHTPFEPR
jgi:hypothetical protein